jgi:hypothetical protein
MDLFATIVQYAKPIYNAVMIVVMLEWNCFFCTLIPFYVLSFMNFFWNCNSIGVLTVIDVLIIEADIAA